MRIAIIILSVVLLIVLIVWVFPEYALTRRLSEDKAFPLIKKYHELPNQSIEKREIAYKLAKAGYIFLDKGEDKPQVIYPKYS